VTHDDPLDALLQLVEAERARLVEDVDYIDRQVADDSCVSPSTSSPVPTLPSTTAALRLSPRSFARFIGEFLNAAENCSCVIASRSRASVRASLPASASRASNGESCGSSLENLTFHGHTSWDVWRYTHTAIPLATGARTLSKSTT
jgi:hypothetical protein